MVVRTQISATALHLSGAERAGVGRRVRKREKQGTRGEGAEIIEVNHGRSMLMEGAHLGRD